MVSTELARTVVGIIGNVLSFLLFISPTPTMLKIYKAKSVQQFKPDPYLATILNCAMWVFYGTPFVHPGTFLVLTINGAGLVIELVYVLIFLYYGTSAARKRISVIGLVELVLFGSVMAVTLAVWHSTKQRSMFVGILCIGLNIIMYSSPLTIMKMVIQTKSVKYMPLPLSVANFFNSGIWLAYSLLKFDINLCIPNAAGLFFAICQLILYACYYKTTDWSDPKFPEVQLPITQKKTAPAA